MRCAGLIVAAGRDRRFGGDRPSAGEATDVAEGPSRSPEREPEAPEASEQTYYFALRGRPLVVWSVEAFVRAPQISSVVLVVAEADLSRAAGLLEEHDLAERVTLCPGGSERVDSVARGLGMIVQDAELVAIHDAARPLVTPELIARVVHAAEEGGAALAAMTPRDAIKLGAGDLVQRTIDRRTVYLAQTPQVFDVSLLRRAFRSWEEAGRPPVTDDAQLVERIGHPVQLVEGDPSNLKVTAGCDLRVAAALADAPAEDPQARAFDGGSAAARTTEQTQTQTRGRRSVPAVSDRDIWPRTGIGYEAHRLRSGEQLVLGGVAIEGDDRPGQHFDTDVLSHAVGDALLGAAALGGYGPPAAAAREHDSRGPKSVEQLARVRRELAAHGYCPLNVDSVVSCRRSELGPYIATIRERLAQILRIDVSGVSVKTTTSGGIDSPGDEEGIAAYATVTVVPAASESTHPRRG